MDQWKNYSNSLRHLGAGGLTLAVVLILAFIANLAITTVAYASDKSMNAPTSTAVTPGADRVSIRLARYDPITQELSIDATSTNPNAALQVFVTSNNELIGTLQQNGFDSDDFMWRFPWSVDPHNITVRSSLGGSAVSTVRER